jgi:hypothetical protein
MTMSLRPERLRFDRADMYEEDNSQCRVEVTFSFADQVIRAHSSCSSEGSGRLKAAAEATLRAMEEVVENRFDCELVDLDHVNALGKDLIAVLVNLSFEGKAVQVFGSCQVTGSEIDAAVKAALNATNRFFELAMRD